MSLYYIKNIVLAKGNITAEKFVTEFEKNVDAITEIEDAMRQEAVNATVEEGMMHVNFSTKVYFDGKTRTKFNIKNIEDNHDNILF